MFSRIVRAGVLAAVVVLIAAPAVLAYRGQVPKQVTVSVVCGPPCVATATVIDVDGKPVTDQVVMWKIDAPATVSPTQSTTNAQGEATTTVTLSSATSPTITATAGDAFGTVVVKCSTGEGLPNTSTAPAGTPVWLLAVVGLAVLAGVGLAARRYALIHR